MPDLSHSFDPEGRGDSPAEAQLRRMLSDRADGLAAAEAPYGTILRQGRAARRRSRVALVAGAAALAAAVPAAAFGASGVFSGGGSEAVAPPASSASSEQRDVTTETPPAAGLTAEPPSDPERQLLDGITLEQAREALQRCLDTYGGDASGIGDVGAGEGSGEEPAAGAASSSGAAFGQLRIVLAWESQGDENRGMEPITQVLAVSDDPAAAEHEQYVCADRPGGAVGLQSSIGELSLDNGLPVYPDPNGTRYYRPMMGEWELPFRWAQFGLVTPEVERVTVTHGGVTEEAVLEAGYFVAAGISEEDPGDARPVVLGYDADGEVVYDSDEDPGYE